MSVPFISSITWSRMKLPLKADGEVVQGCTVNGAKDANSGIKQATGNDHTRVMAMKPGM